MAETIRAITADDRPSMEGIMECIHCGFCLQACPTYRVLGLEADSPRGRIYLIKSLMEGNAHYEHDVIQHIDQCLVCRACETACPSGVKFGQLMDAARVQVDRNYRRPLVERLSKRLILRTLFPYPNRIALGLRLLQLYQSLPLSKFTRSVRIGKFDLGMLGAAMPPVPRRFFHETSREVTPAIGERRYRVGLLSGCMMGTVFSHINQATVRVLTANGCEVIVPPGQRCCGALHMHEGDLTTTRELAKHNINAFLTYDLDAIVVNSAGCGATMKEYKDLFQYDDAYAAKAEQFSVLVQDVNEFLAKNGLNPKLGEIAARVTYQEPCHLAHGQKIKKAPREMLRSIPGLQLVEMKDSDLCCGGAGIYFLLHPAISMKLMEMKMLRILSTKANIVATSNPPCLVQLHAGLNRFSLPVELRHIVELLDISYARAGAYSR